MTASHDHYDRLVDNYDAFGEENSAQTNRLVTSILKKYQISSVLDMTCGTGSQVFWLHKEGFEVTGSDFNSKMIDLAREKSKQLNQAIDFYEGDMRDFQIGNHDAVITIFNAIGHLTKQDFDKTIKNISNNLNTNGLYVFDIFNLNYMLNGDNITKLTIDWIEQIENKTSRYIQYSTIDEKGILASHSTCIDQIKNAEPEVYTYSQTLQIYNASQLSDLLNNNGFEILELCTLDGSEFDDLNTERLFVVARKV